MCCAVVSGTGMIKRMSGCLGKAGTSDRMPAMLFVLQVDVHGVYRRTHTQVHVHVYWYDLNVHPFHHTATLHHPDRHPLHVGFAPHAFKGQTPD